MAASSRKGSGMGTPSLKLNTYRWKLPEKWYQVARTLGKSPKKSSEIANTTPYLKLGCAPVVDQGRKGSVQLNFPRRTKPRVFDALKPVEPVGFELSYS